VTRRRHRTRWDVHLPLTIICLILCIPALYAVQIATLSAVEAFAPVPRLFPPGSNLIDNIRQLFSGSRGFDQLITNTLIAAAVVVIGKTALSLLAGLAFVYFQFPGKWALFFFVLLTLLMPTEIILQPLFFLIGEMNWVQTNPRLALTMPFLASATGVFLFRQHFSNLPRELAEAAQIDGAGPLRFLFAVLIPMSWNVIIAHAVIQFIYMWNQYTWPVLILQEQADKVIQVGVAQLAGSSTQNYGTLMAAGLVASLPPLVLFLLLQKQFMSGFSITRDK
jgi:sn-glycerol 3-phosphate transport system permease protein